MFDRSSWCSFAYSIHASRILRVCRSGRRRIVQHVGRVERHDFRAGGGQGRAPAGVDGREFEIAAVDRIGDARRGAGCPGRRDVGRDSQRFRLRCRVGIAEHRALRGPHGPVIGVRLIAGQQIGVRVERVAILIACVGGVAHISVIETVGKAGRGIADDCAAAGGAGAALRALRGGSCDRGPNCSRIDPCLALIAVIAVAAAVSVVVLARARRCAGGRGSRNIGGL